MSLLGIALIDMIEPKMKDPNENTSNNSEVGEMNNSSPNSGVAYTILLIIDFTNWVFQV